MKAVALDPSRYCLLVNVIALNERDHYPTVDELVGLEIKQPISGIIEGFLTIEEARDVVNWLWTRDLLTINNREIPFRYEASEQAEEKTAGYVEKLIKGGKKTDG